MSSATESFIDPAVNTTRLQRVEREVNYEDLPADWSSYARLMKDYDEAMVRGWKEEVDTLLVFAGLFSAVVTAFNIEAYKLLQEDPSQTSVQLLQQISQQLQAAQLGNATDATSFSPLRSTSFRPSAQSIRINALWFSSLVCALFSALIGIMVKQWLREYMGVVSLSSRDSVRLRQYRFDGLVAWHVPEIMAFLPILLEISVILFLAGIIDFLLLLEATVAAIVTSLIALVLTFYAATTLAPLLSLSCPFKSPQSWLVIHVHSRTVSWTRHLKMKLARTSELFAHGVPHLPNLANWGERDNIVAQNKNSQDELELKAMAWIHASFSNDDTQDSLIPVIGDLESDNASILVFSILARTMHLPPNTLITLVRSRSCGQILRDVGTSFDKRTRTRTVNMLLKLLECIPRDHDSSKVGALDILWVLWELCLGACAAEDQDPLLYQSVLDGMAQLLSEGEPFRLKRAALNLLYESTHTWTYLYCPGAIGNIISFARSCYRHRIPDMFMKASAVVFLLSPGLNWDGDDTMPFHRQQLQELLRDLGRFLRQCNEDGTRMYEQRSVGKLMYGLALLAEKDTELAEATLPDVLLEGAQLGLLELSQEERIMLQGMQATCVVRSFAQRTFEPLGHTPNGAIG